MNKFGQYTLFKLNILFILSALCVYAAADEKEALALAYTKTAVAVFGPDYELPLPGNRAVAQELLKSAQDLDPELADSWFFAALLVTAQQKNPRRKMELLQKAFASEKWKIVSADLARIEMIKLCFSLKEYKKLIVFYNDLTPDNQLKKELHYYYAKSLIYLFRREEALKQIKSYLHDYPFDIDFLYLLYLADKSNHAQLFKVFKQEKSDINWQACLNIAFKIQDDNIRHRFLDQIAVFVLGNQDLNFNQKALLYADGFFNKAEPLRDLLPKETESVDLELLYKVYKRLEKETALKWLAKIKSMGLGFYIDTNKDGHFEYHLSQENDQYLWQFDQNQDFQPEWSLVYSAENRLPLSFENRDWKILYSPYPYARQLNHLKKEENGKGVLLQYHLLEMEFSCPCFESDAFLSSFEAALFFPLQAKLQKPDFTSNWIADQLLQKSSRCDIFDNDISSISAICRWEIYQGKPYRIYEDRSGKGRFNLYLNLIQQDNDFLIKEIFYDPDYDAYYEVHHVYEEGILKETLIDEDHDSKIDFIESGKNLSSPFWDREGDGIVELP